MQKKDLTSVLSYSRYFQIFIHHAVISGLCPNTEYVLHIRATGSHHAGNYGRWKSVEVKTQLVGVWLHDPLMYMNCHLYVHAQSCFTEVHGIQPGQCVIPSESIVGRILSVT